MAWNEQKPVPTDLPDLGLASLITSNKLAFRQGIEKHSFWTDSSTNSIGVPRLSDGSAGPGAARAYYDVQSRASEPASPSKALAGRLFVTSDTTRFFGYIDFVGGVFGTHITPLGGKNLVTYLPSFATIAQNTRNLVQYGQSLNSTSRTTVAFPSAYSVAPKVQLTLLSDGTANPANFGVVGLLTSGTTNFAFQCATLFGSVSNFSVLWRSHGTVSI